MHTREGERAGEGHKNKCAKSKRDRVEGNKRRKKVTDTPWE